MIVRLGSGRAAGEGAGSKASCLDRAARAGLPVPPGVVVLDGAWHWAVERGLVRREVPWDRRPVSVPDPTLLTHLLRLPRFAGPVAVRAAFSDENGSAASPPGEGVPGLFVDGRRAPAVAASLAGVWAAALGRPRGFRRDVILQTMVVARGAGIASTEEEYEDDVVDVAEGGARPLANQQVLGWHLLLPKRRGRERPTAEDPMAARLQTLLRDVRRVFGEKDWEVEWADDGEHIWLVQVRSLARAPQRNELFAAAAACGPWWDPPSRLRRSLLTSCSSGLVDAIRRVDRRFASSRPLIETFQGRPFLNVSLLSDTLRRWGLPSRMVRDTIGGPAEQDVDAQGARMVSHLPTLLRLCRDQLQAAGHARRAAARIRERTGSPPSSPRDVAGELVWLHRILGTTTFLLLAAMSLPLAVLRRARVLGEVAARWQAEGVELLEEVPVLRDELGAPQTRSAPASPSLRARLLRPFILEAEGALGARAHLRRAVRDALGRLEEALLTAARTAPELGGSLPAAEAVFDLDVDELRRLGDDLKPDAAFWSARAAEARSASAYRLPDVVRRLDDLESYRV